MTVQDTQAPGATGVLLSDTAAAKVKALLDQEGRDDLRLRIAVQPGGCSGLRYQLFFDERSLDGDHGDGPHETSTRRAGAHAANTTSNAVNSDFLIAASFGSGVCPLRHRRGR